MTSTISPITRQRPPRQFDSRELISVSLQVVQVILIFGIIAWVIYRGAQAMEYQWQWYRIPQFIFQEIDGAIVFGPLVKGLIETIRLTVISAILATSIGLVTAFARLSNSIAGRWIATFYLEAIRNTPLLVQLYLFYFVIAPIFGVDRFWAAVLCLSFFEGAFAAEIIRGGIIGVQREQYEASDAIGLNPFDKYSRIVIPQALPLILPPITGLLISLVKHSAIVSVIAVSELTTAGMNIISETFMAFEIWFLVAGIYLALTISLSTGVSMFEKSLEKSKN